LKPALQIRNPQSEIRNQLSPCRRDERIHLLRLRRHPAPQGQLQSREVDRRHAWRRGREREAQLAHPRREAELFQDIGGTERWLRALLDELVATGGRATGNRARHGEHRTPLLETFVGRDERARLHVGFHHHHRA